jgi:MFS transporter, DHA1 family, inner membrane transport protein
VTLPLKRFFRTLARAASRGPSCHVFIGAFSIMAFFSNGAVNRVNVHYSIRAFAQAGGGVFFFVYLLQAGVSVPQALLAQAGIVAARFVIRPFVLPLAKRWGLKPMVIAGIFLTALVFPILAQVHGAGWALVAVCVMAAAGDAFYWTSYHAYFSVLGDAEHRGHQVSAREAIAAIIGIVAPLIGAAALIALGPGPMFAAVGIIQACAALPLIGAPAVAIKEGASGTFAAARPGMILQAASGWSAGWTYFLWTIVLSVTLGNSTTAFGGAVALAALVGAVASLVLGRHIDTGRGARATMIAFGIASAVVVLRAFSEGSPVVAVTANALGAVAVLMQTPPMGAMIYNLTKAAPCPLRFQMATEASWDTGVFLACLLGAALVAGQAPLALPILLSLPAQAVMAAVLVRYFRSERPT